ncbi:hypothetical protein FQA39_LY18681 [Lamprigera yunnana]|nr:hypothetical protein FQA39_LY18681 [Lamprigera yunnana]
MQAGVAAAHRDAQAARVLDATARLLGVDTTDLPSWVERCNPDPPASSLSPILRLCVDLQAACERMGPSGQLAPGAERHYASAMVAILRSVMPPAVARSVVDDIDAPLAAPPSVPAGDCEAAHEAIGSRWCADGRAWSPRAPKALALRRTSG